MVALFKTVGYWAEQIAQRAELRLELLLGWFHYHKEQTLIGLVRRWWPRWLTANRLTSFRIMCAALVVANLIANDWQINQWAIGLFVVAVITDLFDGVVARAFDAQSSWGSLLDKLADRLLVVPIAFAEYWPAHRALVIIGLVGVISTLAVTVVNYIRTNRREVPDNIVGKASMILFTAAVVLGFWPQCRLAGAALGWVAIGLAAVSFLYIYPKRLLRVRLAEDRPD